MCLTVNAAQCRGAERVAWDREGAPELRTWKEECPAILDCIEEPHYRFYSIESGRPRFVSGSNLLHEAAGVYLAMCEVSKSGDYSPDSWMSAVVFTVGGIKKCSWRFYIVAGHLIKRHAKLGHLEDKLRWIFSCSFQEPESESEKRLDRTRPVPNKFFASKLL